jgi:pentatricopeptide repeat protein
VDITAYTAVIQALGVNGQGKKALDIFCQIDKTLLDQVVFSCILNACSHSFLVEEARSLLESMQEYDIQPTAVHYTCYADALGRAGYLEKAESIINKYASNDIVAWRALLGACRVRNNVEMAKRVSQKIFKLNPNDASSYVLLSNIFAANEQWEHVDQVRDVMKTRGVKKTPGVSHIEIDGKVHTFYVADTGHSTEVEAVLVQLFEKLKSEGFVHDLSSSLHNGNVEEKIQHLCRHSEKLALGFGLINTPPGTKIRITKNLRMCRDCHNAIRFISKIENRAIVVRDANRFHHFENGKCSCNDKF